MNLSDYYLQIYKLSFINRYTNVIRVRNEDVAQHSFFVAAIVLKLHDEYEFDLGLALQAAISHDITESDLSDVTHAIKEKHSQLADEIKKAELQEIKKYPQAVRDGSAIFEDGSSVEGLIANLADIIQVQQYVDFEIQLGNSVIGDIEKKTRERKSKLQEVLKEYERSSKNS